MGLNKTFAGVWTNPNEHSQVPEGAARHAENVVNPRPGVASTVAGQELLPGMYEELDERLSTGTVYDGCLVESTSGAAPHLYVRDIDGITLTPISETDGTLNFHPPSDTARIRFAEADDALYFPTSRGLRVIDGAASLEVRKAEMPEPLVIDTFTGAGTLFSSPGQSAAYRYVISRLQRDGTYRRSKPSGRAVYTSSGTENVGLFVLLPDGLLATDRIEVYRTAISPAGIDPGDIMHMVAQVNPASSVLSGSTDSQTIMDSTPDELRGDPLYTNSTAEGILRQNERPPMAKDILAFDEHLMLSNVQGPQRFTLRMLALPDDGDTITIAGTTFTGKITGYTGPEDFQIVDAYTVAQNIELTARSLVRAINKRVGVSTRSVTAQYMSGQNDPPGIVQFEAKDVTAATFSAQAGANGDRFEPPLTNAQSSMATTEPSGLWVSKRGMPYAFPPLRSTTASYRLRVGTSGRPILKMAALRDAVIVFVSQDGVWKVKKTGAETWRVDQINNNAHLLVPESVAVVDNQVIAWTTRGVVAVDEGGVEEIDLPIKDQFEEIRKLGPDVVLPVTFAVGDDDRLRYILYHPQTVSDATATHAWVYNADTGTWTERTDPASGGFMGEDDGLLYLGSADANTITRERTGTAAQVYQRPDGTAIPVRLQWTVQDEGDPSAEKQFTELRLLTRENITGSVTFHCTNDLKATETTVGYASDNPNGEPYVMAWVPDGCQRTTRLKVDIRRDVLGEAFDVVGMKLVPADVYEGALTR